MRPRLAKLHALLSGVITRSSAHDRLAGTVVVDERAVTFHRGATTESVRWDELEGVDVMTTDDGPFAEDVFWVLLGPRESGVGAVIPQGLTPEELVDRLTALPGFDHEAMIRAMGSTREASFVCWRAPGSTWPRPVDAA